MTHIPSPGPLAYIEDTPAMLYLGHLAAQAEMALPEAPRDAQIALTWIASHVANLDVRVWTAKLENIQIKDQEIGSWKIRAHTVSSRPEQITLERRNTLCEDGRQIAALAHPFVIDPDNKKSREQGLNSLLDFSVMSLSATANGSRFSTSLRDMNGLQITISARKFREIKIGKKLFIY